MSGSAEAGVARARGASRVPVLVGLRADGTADPGVALRAARAWLAGGIVGLPTETVYGLAADAQDHDAVARVYRVKGRPVGHPLIVHVGGPEALDGWASDPDPVVRRIAEAFWPGPLTVIVRRSLRAGDFLTGGQQTVALRCPDHPVALACLRALGEESADPAHGVAAPSANRFGRVSPTSAADVLAEVGDRLDPARDLVIDGGRSAVGVESTIVDCTGADLRVLRAGAISRDQVQAALRAAGPGGAARRPQASRPGETGRVVPPAQDAPPGTPTRDAAPDPVRVPGTLPSHYAPDARVLLVEEPPPGVDSLAWIASAVGTGADGTGVAGTEVGVIARAGLPTPAGWHRLAAPRDVPQYAWTLYSALREADRLGLRTVVAVLPGLESDPLAVAVRDRLVRSASVR